MIFVPLPFRGFSLISWLNFHLKNGKEESKKFLSILEPDKTSHKNISGASLAGLQPLIGASPRFTKIASWSEGCILNNIRREKKIPGKNN